MSEPIRYYYDALVEADRDWTVAIEKAFPKEHPGDVRYTERGKGAPGSELRAVHDEYVAAGAAFRAAGGFEALQGKVTA